MEEMFTDLLETLAGKRDKLYGVVVGEVADVDDKQGLGRVQVTFPFLDSKDQAPWARVAVPMAGSGHGAYFIPNRGDEVLVAFEQGDLQAPYIIGCLWNATAPPPLPLPSPRSWLIQTLAGHLLHIDEPKARITLKTSTGESVEMSAQGIRITARTSVVDLKPDGVSIKGTNITLEGTAAVTIKAPNVTLDGQAVTTVKGQVCNVTGTAVKIN